MKRFDNVKANTFHHINVLVFIGKFSTQNWKDHKTHIISSCFDLLVKFMLILVPERWISNQQNVQNHTLIKTIKKKNDLFQVEPM